MPLATYYQFDAPFIVDDTAFTDAFGADNTGWDEIVETTLASFRARYEFSSARPQR